MKLRRAVKEHLVSRLPKGIQLSTERLYLTYLKKGYVENQAQMLKALADPTKIALDIGAHRGVFTLFLCRNFAKVHCFEPNPALAAFLRSKFSSVDTEVHNTALGAVRGRAVLNIPLRAGVHVDSRSTLTGYFQGGDVETVEVPITPLDSMDLRNIAFVKIDVEGFEMEVIDGACKTLAREKPIIYIEIEQRFHKNRPIRDIFERILAMGYKGVYPVGSSYRPIETFSLKEMQEVPGEGGEGYVNNFLFLPRETADRDLARLKAVPA